MCDPVSAAIATAVGTAASLAGTYMGAQAQKQQSAAITAANQATLKAQNEGFTQRLNAGLQQTGAQTAAAQETLNARNQAATSMRGQQMQELQRYQDTINAQNAEAERLRSTGDVQAQALLSATNPSSLAQAEEQRRQQSAAMLEANLPASPEATSPDNATGRDPVVGGALARRTAEAATNIRNYGSKIARAGSYAAGPQQTQPCRSPTPVLGSCRPRTPSNSCGRAARRDFSRARSVTRRRPVSDKPRTS